MSRQDTLLPLALFLCGVIGIAWLGARLVYAERDGAERNARERLRARAGEIARHDSDSVAALERLARAGGDGVATMVNGRFTDPREPIDALPLSVVEGRDAEGDFLIAESARSEREGRIDRALDLLGAAAGETRDPSIRTLARIRRAALLRRVNHPLATVAAREALAEMDAVDAASRATSREALFLRRLVDSNAEGREALARDLSALVGGQDDVFARAMLQDLGVDCASRDAELARIAKLRAA
jgi:hypothetical protein